MDRSPDRECAKNAGEARALLAERLRSAEEFDAFCLDCFPDVHRRFTTGMDRLQRENLLLSQVETEELLAAVVAYSSGSLHRASAAKRRIGLSKVRRPFYVLIVIASWESLKRLWNFIVSTAIVVPLGSNAVLIGGALVIGGSAALLALHQEERTDERAKKEPVSKSAFHHRNRSSTSRASVQSEARHVSLDGFATLDGGEPLLEDAGAPDAGMQDAGPVDARQAEIALGLRDLKDPATLRMRLFKTAAGASQRGEKQEEKLVVKRSPPAPPSACQWENPQLTGRQEATKDRPELFGMTFLPVVKTSSCQGTERVYVSREPISQLQYYRMMNENPSSNRRSSAAAVDNVSLDGAMRYCNALSLSESLPQCYADLSKSGEPGTLTLRSNCSGYRLPAPNELQAVVLTWPAAPVPSAEWVSRANASIVRWGRSVGRKDAPKLQLFSAAGHERSGQTFRIARSF